MIKRCSNCGAPAPDDGSVFCNRCGARLPITACRTCGKTVTDPLSRFCDRCGFPLAPAGQGAVPPITLQKGVICPGCGFENFIEDALFCKKCGAALKKGGDSRAVPDSQPRGRAAGTPADSRSAVRREPVSMQVAAPPQPVNPPAVLRQKPAVVPNDMQGVPRENSMDVDQKKNRWSYRKIALVAAVIILIVISIAVVLVFVPKLSGESAVNTTVPEPPGVFDESSANATVPDSAGISGDSSANATVPENAGGLLPNIIDGQETVINQDVPVFADTPLEPRDR